MPGVPPRSLRELREAKGLTLGQLAYQAYVEASKLEKWEQGTLATETTPLRRIAGVLGVTLDDIALPPHERLLNVRGHRFVLSARRREATWTAHPSLWDPHDATEWPKRAIDPAYPDIDSPTIILYRHPDTGERWEEVGSTADEALTALAARITTAMNRALFPSRLPDEPEDWTPPEIPEHWQRHLEARRKGMRQQRAM